MEDNQDYILPDDYTEEEAQEQPVTEEADTTLEAEPTEQAPEQVTQAEEKPFLTLKYNHADVPLTSEEEARNLAQLGYHYKNKVEADYNALKGIKDRYGKMEQLASLYGMSVDQLHETLHNQYVESTAESQGVTPEQIRREQALAQKEAEITAKLGEVEQQNQSKEMYDRFLSVYPNVQAEQIKPETWTLVDKGVDLLTAYTMQVNQEQANQLKQLEQIKANKQTSPAVSTTTHGGAEPTVSDDFLDGLLGH